MSRRPLKIHSTSANTINLSRTAMLAWINETLDANFKRIEELRTGAAYCQLLEMVFPGSISLRRVHFQTNLEHESIENFKLLQLAFSHLKIQQRIDIGNLVKGNYRENLDFLQWFLKFFNENYDRSQPDALQYDAVKARNGEPLGWGRSLLVNKRISRSSSSARSQISGISALPQFKTSKTKSVVNQEEEAKAGIPCLPRISRSSSSARSHVSGISAIPQLKTVVNQEEEAKAGIPCSPRSPKCSGDTSTEPDKETNEKFMEIITQLRKLKNNRECCAMTFSIIETICANGIDKSNGSLASRLRDAIYYQ